MELGGRASGSEECGVGALRSGRLEQRCSALTCKGGECSALTLLELKALYRGHTSALVVLDRKSVPLQQL